MKTKDLVTLGLPQDCVAIATEALKNGFRRKLFTPEAARESIVALLAAPASYIHNETWGDLATAVCDWEARRQHEEDVWGHNPYRAATGGAAWGAFGFAGGDDPGAIEQMQTAVELPVAVQGALMPDCHLGYGLPIGGVLATYNSVIPYGVGVDIACRMRLTITDLPAQLLADPNGPQADTLVRALTKGTVFGVGGTQEVKADHTVLDRDWNITSVTRASKDKAWAQLGTSGSGNHFVEFGILTLDQPDLGLAPGSYVALLSHSGSRGAGAAVCKTYSDIARTRLPKSYERFANLAWLSLDSEAGQEYWAAMNLMGEYACANHQVIHQRVLGLAGASGLAVIENHHNFAWLEVVDGKELVVHRKGATPAGPGVLGVIPGSMADPAFVVRGKGQPASLQSASHGAGRKMSRTQAIKTFHWDEWRSILQQRGVRVLSCGLDEVPGVYKDIREVMAAQADLVDVVARFDPKLVKMSEDGKAED